MKKIALAILLGAVACSAAIAGPTDYFYSFDGNYTGYGGGIFHDVPADVVNQYGDPTFYLKQSSGAVGWSYESLGGGNSAWRFQLTGSAGQGKYYWSGWDPSGPGGANDPWIGGNKNWTAAQGGQFVGATLSLRVKVNDIAIRTDSNEYGSAWWLLALQNMKYDYTGLTYNPAISYKDNFEPKWRYDNTDPLLRAMGATWRFDIGDKEWLGYKTNGRAYFGANEEGFAYITATDSTPLVNYYGTNRGIRPQFKVAEGQWFRIHSVAYYNPNANHIVQRNWFGVEDGMGNTTWNYWFDFVHQNRPTSDIYYTMNYNGSGTPPGPYVQDGHYDFSTDYMRLNTSGAFDPWGNLVPEPCSLFAMATGLAGLVGIIRRRK